MNKNYLHLQKILCSGALASFIRFQTLFLSSGLWIRAQYSRSFEIRVKLSTYLKCHNFIRFNFGCFNHKSIAPCSQELMKCVLRIERQHLSIRQLKFNIRNFRNIQHMNFLFFFYALLSLSGL